MLVARGRLERRQAIVEIGFQAFVPQILAVEPEQRSIEIPIQGYRALLDTGAQRTCLTRRVIGIESLKSHGKRFIQNVHNEARHYLYWATIGFFANGTDTDVSETRTYFGLPHPTEIIDIANNENFDAILGMDVLERFDLRFDRTGDFELRLA
ncbi:hypothetical protein [Sphingomonas bacterium]|uniref:hypothetical protein n=1 Tax=Sphingomonas bacterium TaxID=1895847 RepID=UPI002616BDE2|nr:hypothetical protein [Sphingomonas bacterium]MDB5678201.1 motif domain protein [Sphingomonas bacterium]